MPTDNTIPTVGFFTNPTTNVTPEQWENLVAIPNNTITNNVLAILDDIQQQPGLTPPSLAEIGKELTAKKEKEKVIDHFKELKLNKQIKYPTLSLNKTQNAKFEKNFLYQHKITQTDTLFGIEVEVENIKNEVPCDYYWGMKNDGSLRNNGYEFVSSPLRIDQIEPAVYFLKNSLNYKNSPDFSNRTSVHVHVNVRDMTPEQVWCFVILYTMFEKHFYKFAGTRRESSIFCVPLYKTNYLRNLNRHLIQRRNVWSKYCGLNILPIWTNNTTGCYGTIEFRHLYGTVDVSTLVHWCNSIACLYNEALKWDKESLEKELLTLNTTSGYNYMYNKIFGEYALSNLKKLDFESCISYVKKELFGQSFQNLIPCSVQSDYWTAYTKSKKKTLPNNAAFLDGVPEDFGEPEEEDHD